NELQIALDVDLPGDVVDRIAPADEAGANRGIGELIDVGAERFRARLRYGDLGDAVRPGLHGRFFAVLIGDADRNPFDGWNGRDLDQRGVPLERGGGLRW